MTTPHRLFPGMVVVREDVPAHSALVWTPCADKKDLTSHRGTVIAMGPPAKTKKGVEVPHGFGVGDVVIWHWETLERAWTRPWFDGVDACWVPQSCIDAVVE